MKIKKNYFHITLNCKDHKELKVKDSRRDAMLEIGRMLSSTKLNCHINIHRTRKKNVKSLNR